MLLQIMLTQYSQPSLFIVICCFTSVPILIFLVSGSLCPTDILMMTLKFFVNAALRVFFSICLPDFYISISIIPEYIMQVFAVASQYKWWAAIESTCQSQQSVVFLIFFFKGTLSGKMENTERFLFNCYYKGVSVNVLFSKYTY